MVLIQINIELKAVGVPTWHEVTQPVFSGPLEANDWLWQNAIEEVVVEQVGPFMQELGLLPPLPVTNGGGPTNRGI
jgi:hypothetical protein